MKKLFLVTLIIFTASLSLSRAQATIPDRQAIIDSLTTIDPAIIKYFPRWKICEPDLMIQIYQAFLYKKYDESMLNQQDIEVLGAPKEFPGDPYEILVINCGDASMNAVQIDSWLGDLLVNFLSGAYYYSGPNRGYQKDYAERDYCFTEIPNEMPLKPDQASAIIDYLQPTNVTHAFTLSLFEQAMKIGNTGFWIRNKLGTDELGYHFWESGDAKVVLQRPLYVNKDSETNSAIPYLINAYLGGVYRLTNGVNVDNNDLLGWVSERTLNSAVNGKLVAGLDFHMPFEPGFGIGLNMELPLENTQTYKVDIEGFGRYEDVNRRVEFAPSNPYAGSEDIQINAIVPILRTSAQVSLFYHYWINQNKSPENYFKFNFGLSYHEVQEYAHYGGPTTDIGDAISTQDIEGLKTYKPNEAADWIYAKVEYRNQAVYPFGASFQYSNQIFLGRVYIPLFGDWLYLEGRYSTPLRGVRPYEIENFFMISPVIRLTI